MTKPVTTMANGAPAGVATTGFISTSSAGPKCARWLDENGIHLGSSDESADHWLIVDASTGDLYAAPSHEAKPILRLQRMPE